MVKMLTMSCVALCLFTSTDVKAVAVTTNSGSGLAASYTSLANAITALNAAVISSPVVITCAASGTETTPAGGFSITASGTAVNTITITGSSSTITAFTPQASGILVDAIFKLVGADFVTIQGFTMLENAANTTTAAGTNNMTEWGVALLERASSTIDGSQSNTIQNNTISLSRLYQNSFGIYSNPNHTPTAVTTTVVLTNALEPITTMP